MNKTKFKAYLTTFILIIFLVSSFAEVILRRALASKSFFFGLSRYAWANIDYHSHLLLFLLVLIHLALHWEEIENLPKILKKK